jgi:hypothetical protein
MNIKKYTKGFPLYWWAKRLNAQRKISEVLSEIKCLPSRRTSGQGDETILVFSSIGIFADQLTVDILLAEEIKSRGNNVVLVLCDGILPACHVSDVYSLRVGVNRVGRSIVQSHVCSNCFGSARDLINQSDIKIATFSDGIRFVRDNEIQVPDLGYEDEVRSATIRYAASSYEKIIKTTPDDITAKYQRASLTAAEAIYGLIKMFKPTTIVAHHGIYIPQGVVQKIAKSQIVDFYSWHFGYRKSTLIFSKGDTYHRELTGTLAEAFEQPLLSEQKAKIQNYLMSRVSGNQDWIHFNRNPIDNKGGGNKSNHFVCYTSVDWDAALHFPSSVYTSQFEFLSDLVEVFRRYPNLHLTIRIHPAEISGFHPSSFSSEKYLTSLNLPKNINIVAADSRESSYALAKSCVCAIVYNTKLGIELPAIGIPVIVAGDCWIRGKGFSYDVLARGDLEKFIRSGGALRLSDEQIERALMFAYYFYFQRCIQTDELKSVGPKFQVKIDKTALAEGKRSETGLSFIAKKILEHQDVVLDR